MTKRLLVLVLVLTSSARPGYGQRHPPEPYTLRGVCPFECCQAGPWKARGPIKVFRTPTSTSAVAFALAANEAVVAERGDVIADRLGRVLIRRPPVLSPEYSDSTLRLAPGDTLYVTSYAGEDSWFVWHRGRIHWTMRFWPVSVGTSGDTPLLVAPHAIWWVQVRRHDRSAGWVRAATIGLDGAEGEYPGFDGMDSCSD